MEKVVDGVKEYDVNSTDPEERQLGPVEDWLRNFRDCGFVVTESFHATVFSIIFHKPFLVIKNEDRGLARIVSLLDSLGLRSRLVEALMSEPPLDMEIDWEDVDRKMEALRQKSFNFLERAGL